MAEREPSLLSEPPDSSPGDDAAEPEAEPRAAAGRETEPPRPAHSRRTSTRSGPTHFVAGFWRRTLGGVIDLAVILPVATVLGWLAGAVSGIHLPESRHRGLDFWLDLLLANDPAFIGWLALSIVVGCVYLFVFQSTLGRTLGMRATKTRIIDMYGDPPTVVRAGLRTGGYLLGLATLGLGFLWAGFDPAKRGVQDWIAGTYVVKS